MNKAPFQHQQGTEFPEKAEDGLHSSHPPTPTLWILTRGKGSLDEKILATYHIQFLGSKFIKETKGMG